MSIFNAILARHELAPPLLYGISNRKLHPGISLESYLASLFQSRADLIQWREKDLPWSLQKSSVEQAVRLAASSGKIFLVNTETELALAAGADGVHLTSQQSAPRSLQLRNEAGRAEDFLIGQSVHTVREALRAESQGVDYLLLGPVFDPISKQSDRMPLGLPGLREAAYMLYIPVFALGGITLDKLPYVQATAAVGIAGISWLSREIGAAGEGE